MKKAAPWLFLSLLLIGLLAGTVHKVGFGDLWFEFDQKPNYPTQYKPGQQYGYSPSYGGSYDYVYDSYGGPGGAVTAGSQPGCWYVSNC